MAGSVMKVVLPDNSELELPVGASGLDAARAMTEHLLAAGRTRVTVDPYEWNEPAIRAWGRAGFVELSRGHPPDEDHTAPWVLMEYRR